MNTMAENAEQEGVKQVGSIATSTIDGTSQILVELLRASAANPIMAAATIIIVADILEKREVISANAATNLEELIAALTAVDVLGSVLKQSVTTLAYGAEAATSASALLGLL